jgi:uncharacterized protein YraI
MWQVAQIITSHTFLIQSLPKLPCGICIFSLQLQAWDRSAVWHIVISSNNASERKSQNMFNRSILIVVIAILLSIFGLASAVAQEPTTLIAPADGVPAVNVRSGPGIEFTTRFALNAGYTLSATGRTEATACTGNTQTDGWLRIAVSETIEGWVNVCAIVFSGDVNMLPVAEPTFPQLIEEVEPLEVLEGGSNFTNRDLIAETKAAATMRSEPWLGSEAFGIIPANAVIELVQMTTNMGWLQAQYGDKKGWLPGFVVSITEQQVQQLPTIENPAVLGGGQPVQTDCVNGASLVVSVTDLIRPVWGGGAVPFPFYVFICA